MKRHRARAARWLMIDCVDSNLDIARSNRDEGEGRKEVEGGYERR
jgi:hypothetical protein